MTSRPEREKTERDARFRDEALRWLPEVTRYAVSLARHEADAEDLVQETFLRAYRAWDQYAAGTECRGWLFTICRHAYLRTHSRDRRQIACDDAELEALAAAALHTSAVQGGYGDLFATVDLTDAVDRALAGLPDEFREAIILVDLEDQSYAAAAGVLGVPVGTVRSRLFRGRRLMQETLLAYARDAGLVRDSSDGSPGAELER